jgi:hypothetical protein
MTPKLEPKVYLCKVCGKEITSATHRGRYRVPMYHKDCWRGLAKKTSWSIRHDQS